MRRTAFVLLTIMLSALSYAVSAQYASRISYSQVTDDKTKKSVMLIRYDLIASSSNIACQIILKRTILDTTSVALHEVAGDVGIVFPGKDKKIVWKYVEELVNFKGDIKLTIDVTPVVNVVGKIKRKRPLKIKLARDFSKEPNGDVRLYRSGKEILTFNNASWSTNSVTLVIPRKVSARKGYQLAIGNGDRVWFSNNFRVRRKFALGWLAAPVVMPLIVVPVILLVKQYHDDHVADLPAPPIVN